MDNKYIKDWGEISEIFDTIKAYCNKKDLTLANEAQTRFDVIDRLIKEVFEWKHGQIAVEERDLGTNRKYVDYVLRAEDIVIVIEAKKIGAAFPTPTKKKTLRLYGSVLGEGEIYRAINQALEYGITKNAKIIIVTNGNCWCIFKPHDSKKERDIDGHLYFPFDIIGDAEELFNILHSERVITGSLDKITNYVPPIFEKRLLTIVKDSEARIDRNNIADFITPALNNALYADAIISNPESLNSCFVFTEARRKYDKMLDMHLVDPKPITVRPAKRIKTGMKPGHFDKIIERSIPNVSPPVTLMIAPVGCGKSTFLKYFEIISGKKSILEKSIHWIYINFELMGKTGNPREFLYSKLKDYIHDTKKDLKTDFKTAIEPAYRNEIDGLKKGPWALIAGNKEKFYELITNHIESDLDKIEPYVDKIFKYISQNNICVIILDNIDLYEDEILETTVLSEGLALAGRLRCNVIISLRDITFVRHKNDSIFDAFEMRKFWLDPPPLKAVLSQRLTFSKKILEGKQAQIDLPKGIVLKVDDLSVFFNIVQRSILEGEAGEFIDALSDINIRKGLTLVTNFLTSGHINTERSIETYLTGKTYYPLPFHEIFKGSILGQYRYYKENRSDCVNIFDSRLGASILKLLRFLILSYLYSKSRSQTTAEVSVSDCITIFTKLGANELQVCDTLMFLCKSSLIRSTSLEKITRDSTIFLTRSGGYCFKFLSTKFVYVETCMYDTAIDDDLIWDEISNLTVVIEEEHEPMKKMELRQNRITLFLDYLCRLESETLKNLPGYENLGYMNVIKDTILKDVEKIVVKIKRRYPKLPEVH